MGTNPCAVIEKLAPTFDHMGDEQKGGSDDDPGADAAYDSPSWWASKGTVETDWLVSARETAAVVGALVPPRSARILVVGGARSQLAPRGSCYF